MFCALVLLGVFGNLGPLGAHKAQDPAYLFLNLFLNVGPFLPFRWPFGPEVPLGAHESQGPWGTCPNINVLNVVPFEPLVPLGPGATLGTSPKTHSLELLSLYPWAPCDLAPKPVFSVGPFGPFGTKGPDGLMGPCPKNVFLLSACPFENPWGLWFQPWCTGPKTFLFDCWSVWALGLFGPMGPKDPIPQMHIC